jgi:hypothetical protein
MTENIDIKQVFWKALRPGKTPNQAWTDLARWGEIYDHGFVDPRRLQKKRWMDILKQLPNEEGQYLLGREHVEKIAQFLYSGPLKRPFDPQRLNAGTRPPTWIQEMYQKVLKFETDIKPAEWNQLVQTVINPEFMEKGQYRFDQDFKDFISEILLDRASLLRKLEVWAFIGPPGQAEAVPTPPPPEKKAGKPQVIADSFETKPKELEKIRSIEKLYYHSEKTSTPNDKETLEFLDDLDELEDEGEELK